MLGLAYGGLEMEPVWKAEGMNISLVYEKDKVNNFYVPATYP